MNLVATSEVVSVTAAAAATGSVARSPTTGSADVEGGPAKSRRSALLHCVIVRLSTFALRSTSESET
jgi:hypothetical protein